MTENSANARKDVPRLSYCGAAKDVTEGLDRIKWALDPNSANELYLGDRTLVRDWL